MTKKGNMVVERRDHIDDSWFRVCCFKCVIFDSIWLSAGFMLRFFLRVSILCGKIMKFNLKIKVAFLLVIYVLIRNQFCIYGSSTIQFYHDNFIKPILS